MVETRQTLQPKRKKPKKEEESLAASDKKKKLKDLDDFIEGVLEEAGEEFLEEFKQVEGQ